MKKVLAFLSLSFNVVLPFVNKILGKSPDLSGFYSHLSHRPAIFWGHKIKLYDFQCLLHETVFCPPWYGPLEIVFLSLLRYPMKNLKLRERI